MPEHKLKIGATLLPLYLVAQEVAGNAADVQLIPSAGAASPGFLPDERVAHSFVVFDIIFWSGTALDDWFTRLLPDSDVKGSTPRLVNIAKGINLLPSDRQENGASPLPAENPYYWLDMGRTIIIASTMRDELIALEPQRKMLYWSQTSAFFEQLTVIDRDIRERRKGFATHYLVSEYPFFTYFDQSYGLTPLGSLAAQRGGARDDAHLARITHDMKTHKVRAIFVSPDTPSWITEFAQTQKYNLYVFDPMLYSTSTAGLTFNAIMRRNIESLSQGLHYQPPAD